MDLAKNSAEYSTLVHSSQIRHPSVIASFASRDHRTEPNPWGAKRRHCRPACANLPIMPTRDQTIAPDILAYISHHRVFGPTRGRDRTSIAELLADERCSQALLQFFATTDVGRTSGHRWPRKARMRPVRPRNGKRGTKRSGLGRGERRRGWGRSRVFNFILFPSLLSLTFFISFVFLFILYWAFWRLGGDEATSCRGPEEEP